MDDEISYKQWVSVESKAMLMTVVSTVQDFMENHANALTMETAPLLHVKGTRQLAIYLS